MRQRQVFVVLIAQGILMLLAAAVGLVWKGPVVVASVFWGGLAALVPTALFAWIVFGWGKIPEGTDAGQTAPSGSDVLRKWAVAWIAKFVATALIFALALLLGHVQPVDMLLTFAAIVLLCCWPAALIKDTVGKTET